MSPASKRAWPRSALDSAVMGFGAAQIGNFGKGFGAWVDGLPFEWCAHATVTKLSRRTAIG
ncbi:hypothetical protein AWB75_05268 [Caballeronia catudaia]|uniref:Uncharacterized protein n=1 Tax=Caballeronia catudaia TaxID=1777136 RepID=A0A158CJN8_9BURK|nr:hypothetical protein AWB75_05268 [Caballeronia catudaia]